MKPERVDSSCLIVYDGECSFCRNQMEWVRGRDTDQRFEFVPFQDPELARRFPALEGQDFNSGLRFIGPDGSVSAEADAVYGIARRLPRWRYLAWLYRVPGLHVLAQKIYRWIAARRHSLRGGQCKSCDL